MSEHDPKRLDAADLRKLIAEPSAANRAEAAERVGTLFAAGELTDREREIARLLALGHTNQEIANQLYLSVRTVETHRAHIMTKLRLDSRAELVQWALDSGLIEIGRAHV